MVAPGAPSGLTLTAKAGIIEAVWNPSTGSPTLYSVEWSTDSFASYISTLEPASSASKTIEELTPGTTYSVRIRAINSASESSGYSNVASATPPSRTALSGLRGASIQIAGMQVELRSDGDNDNPVYTLGYIPFGPDTGGIDSTFTTIGTLLSNKSALSFGRQSDPRAFALTSNAAGDLFVIGTSGASVSNIVIRRYLRTGPSSWGAGVSKVAALPSGRSGFAQHAAVYVKGTGASAKDSILILSRRHGSTTNEAIVASVINPRAFESLAFPLVQSYATNPGWLTYPGSPVTNSGVVDLVNLSGTRVAALANDTAVINVVNGVISSVTKGGFGAFVSGPFARLVAMSDDTFAVLRHNSLGNLAIAAFFTGGSGYSETFIDKSGSWAGTFNGERWDAFYDRRERVVKIAYVPDDSLRKVEVYKFSEDTRGLDGPTVLTSALGPGSSTNGILRVPSAPTDERRVVIESDNLSSGTKSVALVSDRSGNVAPFAPALVTKAGFDAAYGETFAWTFSDANPADTQRAYELQIQRVGDSVDVYLPGKTATSLGNRPVPANTLVNGVGYRWRVRTYDASDIVGPWSSYDSFTTAALGLLVITSPDADNPAGLNTSSIALTWSYTQPDGYVQTSRRVRLIRVSDGAVLSDTGMVGSTDTSYVITSVPTDVPVRAELSIVNNGPGTPTITKSRLFTTSYGLPMTPELVVNYGPSYVEIVVNNPTPLGSRPEVFRNDIMRRVADSGEPFIVLARVGHNGSYRDYTVQSDADYEYQVRGVGADV